MDGLILMRWYLKLIIFLAIVSLIGGLIYMENEKWKIPKYVKDKQTMLKSALSEENLKSLEQEYLSKIFKNKQKPATLLFWLGELLSYANPKLSYDPTNKLLSQLRAEEDHYNPNVILSYGVGRCEEFSIVYAAFLKVAGFDVHLVYDFSVGKSKTGKQNGDHVWVEVNALPGKATSDELRQWSKDGFFWCHVDPVEGAIWARKQQIITSEWDLELNPYINNPYMYERDWGKEVKDAWAISSEYAFSVTQKYQYGG